MIELPRVALSVRQPWAWAIVFGHKDIENRTIPAVKHGMKPGRIAIHASKGMTQDEYEMTREFMERNEVECPHPSELVRGGIIGAVTVTEIVAESESPWFFGPRGLVLTDPVALPSPIPAMGKLGYFKWQGVADLDEPKPWMKAWPEKATRSASAPKQKPTEQTSLGL